MNYKNFFLDVFRPLKTDVFVFIEDTIGKREHKDWSKQHAMLLRWKSHLKDLSMVRGFTILPDLYFNAPMDENAPIFECVREDGSVFAIERALENATVFICFSKASISATLNELCNKFGTLRGVSMPGIIPEMEDTALAVNHDWMRKRCARVAVLMETADCATVEFSSGHKCIFDLRFRSVLKDDGYCGIERAGQYNDALINLPSGEVCQATYEGEINGHPSMTCGCIPVYRQGSLATLHVEGNRIIMVDGSGELQKYFMEEPGRCNVAEFGIGLNDRAVVRGNDLEDEKAGFHLAYGRSDSIGGGSGPEAFRDPSKICHVDIVYPKGARVFAKNIWLMFKTGSQVQMLRDGEFLI